MVKRKILAADEKLAMQMVKIAEEKGQTLYSLVNEALEQTVNAHNMGLTLKRIVQERGTVETAKEAGFVLTIKTLWFDIVETAFNADKRSMLEKWCETGRWYGKYFAVKNPEKPVEALEQAVRNLMWGSSEFHVKLNDGKGEACCISGEFTESYTRLLSAFLKGALEALGYVCTKKNVSKGIIRIMFKKGE